MVSEKNEQCFLFVSKNACICREAQLVDLNVAAADLEQDISTVTTQLELHLNVKLTLRCKSLSRYLPLYLIKAFFSKYETLYTLYTV